jgi:Tol biopolymer transport system component
MNRHAAALALITLAFATLVSPDRRALSAQEPSELSPHFTRVLGTEHLGIQNAALSPDGRWIAFSREEDPSTFNLWLVSAHGGDPIRLTRGAYSDMGPEWFPSGDRVLFRSDRPDTESKVLYAMSLDVDPRTGQPLGAPRQITLDDVVDKAVSPDGRWIAYSKFDQQNGRQELRVIGSRGGTPRTVADRSDFRRIAWSGDGAFIHFLARDNAQDLEQRRERVRVSDGARETLGTLPNLMTHLSEDHSHYAQVVRGSSDATPTWTIHRAGGELIGRVTLGRGMRPVELRNDGTLVAVAQDVVAPLTVKPVQGGMPWVVGNSGSYEWPVDWSSDGESILFSTQLDGHQVLMSVPREGGAAVEVDLTASTKEGPGATRFTPDGKRLIYHADSPAGADVASLVLQDLETGSLTLLTDSAPRYAFATGYLAVTGRGGEPSRDGEDLLFEGIQGGRVTIFSVRPDGERRTLWTFPDRPIPRKAQSVNVVAVAVDRLAWTEDLDEGGEAVMIASVGDPEPKELLRAEGLGELTWSRDGSRLAIASYPDRGFLVADVDERGRLAAEPVLVGVPAAYFWDLRWTPDDRAVTLVGMAAERIADSAIWLVPVDPTGSPVALTGDDHRPTYGYALSPDGRFIAYPPEKQLGSSIWLVDMGAEVGADPEHRDNP